MNKTDTRMRKVDDSATTPSGIPGIGDLPWGSHVCQWYFKRADLAGALVPYIAAGLRNNERCIWVTGAPYEMAEARHDLGTAVAGLDEMVADNQLRVLGAGSGYVNGDNGRGVNLFEQWLVEERETLAGGYNGLRIASNASFVGEGDWQAFIDHENAFNQEMLQKHRIVALCSYNALDVQPKKILQAVHCHQFTIQRAGPDWKKLAI